MSSNQIRSLVVILIITATVMGGHLLPGLDNSRVEDGVRNGLHLLVFAVFAVIIFERLKFSGVFVSAAVTIIAVGVIGSLSEFVQYLAGRQPDIFDVIRDLTGAALALTVRILWTYCRDSAKSRVLKLAGQAVAVVVGFLIVTPFCFWASIIVLGRISAPVILDFDQWWNQYTYRAINAEIIEPGKVEGAADIVLRKSILSGVVISPMMTDWSDYDSLVISAHMLKDAETNVTIRINDSARRNSWSDEFLAWIVVSADTSPIRIPLGILLDEPGKPTIDLSDIQELVFFARDPKTYDVMIIDDIHLE